MSIRDTTSYKQQLLAQRATLLGQLATLRGGPVGRAQASATHFGEREPDSRAQGGASCWDGVLAVRLLARDGEALLAAIRVALSVLRDQRALPRVWRC